MVKHDDSDDLREALDVQRQGSTSRDEDGLNQGRKLSSTVLPHLRESISHSKILGMASDSDTYITPEELKHLGTVLPFS